METSSEIAIEAVGLVKDFGQTRVVEGVDLTVRRGSIYGFLGPNGAGKTTTIRMLATLLRPDGGTARVFGHDVVREADAVRRRISLTGQFASIDGDLTGLENLTLLARLLGYPWDRARARARELLEAFDLTEAAGRVAKTYSGGMRRRLDIAASLVATPDLLFLDEPTTGLDPRSRNMIWEVARALVAEGTTILLTTQYLDEADHLAERIAVIDHGKIIAKGTTAQLKASVGAGVLHIRLVEADQRLHAEQTLSQVFHAPAQLDADPASLSIQIASGPAASDGVSVHATRALDELPRAGVAVSEFAFGQPSLDEVFLALTGRPSTPSAGSAGASVAQKTGAQNNEEVAS